MTSFETSTAFCAWGALSTEADATPVSLSEQPERSESLPLFPTGELGQLLGVTTPAVGVVTLVGSVLKFSVVSSSLLSLLSMRLFGHVSGQRWCLRLCCSQAFLLLLYFSLNVLLIFIYEPLLLSLLLLLVLKLW